MPVYKKSINSTCADLFRTESFSRSKDWWNDGVFGKEHILSRIKLGMWTVKWDMGPTSFPRAVNVSSHYSSFIY